MPSNTNIIPSDAPSVFDVITMLSTLNQQAIIRPNNPPPGIAGFLFDIKGDESIELTSEITDHYIEDNTSVQDQIALRPEQYTVAGLIAELTDAPGPSSQQPAPIANTLPLNPPFVPVITPGAKQVQIAAAAAAQQATNAVLSTPSLYTYYLNQGAQPPSSPRQTSAFGYFYQLWKGRQLFSVETAWGFFTNMAILTFRAEQSEESNQKTDFSITFKKMRFVADIIVITGQLAGRLANQAAATTQNGNAGQTAVSDSQKESVFYGWVAGVANSTVPGATP